MAPTEVVGSPTSRFETGYPSPRATRSPSISSDIPSSVNTHSGLLSPPTSVSPDAAFIAVSAASQIVTNDHDSQSEAWLDQHGIEPSGETALVSPPALKLVNRFLDQLLFNFLSVSRSTSLSGLRPAVAEVLKPKLARGAIAGADSELHEYLGGEEEEDLLTLRNGTQSKDWDLELVWKRTRLRCMVYSSLGDMEEEEEDYYTEQEQLDSTGSSQLHGVVSPAVAIFLTSVLEFMGEQVLVVAGQAAYHRLRLKHERDEKDGNSTHADIAERVVVEDTDMERVALDRTLGRLWRGWKKRIRSPIGSVSIAPRPFSRESTQSQPRAGHASGAATESQIDEDLQEGPLTVHEHAALIPLPSTEDDVREIEVPGLAQEFDDDDEAVNEADDEAEGRPARPMSFQFWAHPTEDLQVPAPSNIHIPKFVTATSRKRSYSSPTAVTKRPKPSAEETSEEQGGVEGDEAVDAADEAADAPQDGAPEDEQTAQPSLPARSPARRGLIVSTAGAAAVAAAMATKHEAHGAESDGGIDSDEELHEEPQIMTSSRVSIGGRISPEDNPMPSKRSSVRSHSVHSLRLIEVSSPKSPARSRGTSVDASDYPSTGRPTIVTPGSIVSPILITPHGASPISQVRTASPISRNGSSNSSRRVANSTTDSIEESDEYDTVDNELGPEPAIPSHFAAAMQGVDVWSPEPPYPAPPAAREAREAKPQPSAFVLSPAPATRNARGNTSAPMQDHPNYPQNQQGSALAVAPKMRGDGAPPPLTPLREMMEGAPDTSDEASSVAQSHDGQSYSERRFEGHSPSVSNGSLIQRSHRAPSIPRGSPPRSSREESSRKDYGARRPTHTSGSTSSSASHKFKAIRSSEDSGRVEDKGKSFEQLIRSDQTIQYTLTPANMRDSVAPDSPHSPRLIASPIRSNFPTFPEGPRPGTGRSHSSSVGKYGKPSSIDASAKNQKPVNGGSKLALNTAPPPRTTSYQPRDARVEAESIEDFADFIKATGPPQARYETGPRSAPPVEAPRFPPPTRIQTDSVVGTSSGIPNGLSNGLPRRMDSAAGRTRLQARDAVVTRADGINDLIDFMRSGPQNEAENHRAPRRGAPDTDYLAESAGGHGDPRYSQTPTTASVQSSVTSQSALLNGAAKMSKPPPPPQKNRDADEEDMMPKRKTRRVRDMYQIDFSDEEEEYEMATAGRPKPIQEESLADFLRNAPPPPENTVLPVFDQAPAQSNKIKRKSSTTGIMSRFGRNSQMGPKPGSSQGVRPGSRADTALSNHTPISVQFPSTYRTSTNEEPRLGEYSAPRIDPPRTKVQQKSYQPREAVYSTSRTNELAAFLRDSDPPTAMHAQPQTFTPTLQKEESSTFQRVFGRRKVH